MMTGYEKPSNLESQNNNRSRRREHLIYYLRVYESASKSYLGRVVDMSEQGLMLVLDKHVEGNAQFNLVIEMPEDVHNNGHLQLAVVSKWCNQDVNKDYFIAGFEFENITASASSSILKLLDEYAFSLSVVDPEPTEDQ